MWVQMRSRNQRSWEMTRAQPGNSVGHLPAPGAFPTSRSLDGSSSSRTLPPAIRVWPDAAGPRSPPRGSRHSCPGRPLEVAADAGAAGHLELADLRMSRPSPPVRRKRSCCRQAVLDWSTKAIFGPSGRRHCAGIGLLLAGNHLNRVDLPAPLGPMMPTMAPGGRRRTLSISSLSPKALLRRR